MMERPCNQLLDIGIFVKEVRDIASYLHDIFAHISEEVFRSVNTGVHQVVYQSGKLMVSLEPVPHHPKYMPFGQMRVKRLESFVRYRPPSDSLMDWLSQRPLTGLALNEARPGDTKQTPSLVPMLWISDFRIAVTFPSGTLLHN